MKTPAWDNILIGSVRCFRLKGSHMNRNHLNRALAGVLAAVSIFPAAACSRSEAELPVTPPASTSTFVSVDTGSTSVITSVTIPVIPGSSETTPTTVTEATTAATTESSETTTDTTVTEPVTTPEETTVSETTTSETTPEATTSETTTTTTTPPETTTATTTTPATTSAATTTPSETVTTVTETTPAETSETSEATVPPVTLIPETVPSETTTAESEPVTESTTEMTTAATTEPPATTTVPVETTKTPYTGGTNVIDLGNVLVIGNSAMEHYYGVDSALQSYAKTVSTFKAKLPGVNVYAMFCPSAVEFCAPSKYQAGTRSQRRAMNVIYNALTNGAIGVDTWSELNAHAGEYLYFRTDHHWTQRGAYYAYRAFCKAAGFTPHEMYEYETGTVQNFVGTMSIYAKDYASRFYNNPDYVEFFRPIHSAKMTVYTNPSMTNGTGGYVMYSKEYTDKLNRAYKYSMFTGGDHPLAMIVSDTVKNGRKLLITKESYGNALIPFLTDHFEVIYVVDPREFNTSGKPNFNLVSFAQSHGVTDVICCNAAVLLPGINTYLKKMY